MMKKCIALSALGLLLCSSFSNAVTEESKNVDDGRELGMTAAEKKALRKKMRMEKKMQQKEQAKKGMYFELVYMEKECSDFEGLYTPLIGDKATFNCELYQKAVNYGTYGGEKVGDTYWDCEGVSFILDASQVFLGPDPIWDCTITDYIGGGIGSTYIRSEGITLGIMDEADNDNGPEEEKYWEAYHGHTGNFATVGGINEAKGIRGQLDVVWDNYKMSWFHIYHVEAWNMGPQPDYW